MNTDQMVKAFIDRIEKCNIVNAGCGLETSYFRIKADPGRAVFREMDLPEAIFEAMHGILIRTHTVAAGDDYCDWWYFGDGILEKR